MDSERLAQEIATVVTLASDRVTGIGRVQYEYQTYEDGVKQDFELRSFPELVQQTLEEIEDTINHLCMMHIRVRMLGGIIEKLEEVTGEGSTDPTDS